MAMTAKDTQEPFTTGSLRVAQFIARQKPFVVDFNVPKAEFQFGEMPARYRPLNSPSDAHRIDSGVP